MGWAPSWPHFLGVAVSFFDEWLFDLSRTVVKMRRFRFSTSFPSCMIRCSLPYGEPRRSVASSLRDRSKLLLDLFTHVEGR